MTDVLTAPFIIATGDNVKLDHAYIWNNVHIASNVVISQSVVCDKAEVKAGVTLNKQCVLAYNVSSACSIIYSWLWRVKSWFVSLHAHTNTSTSTDISNFSPPESLKEVQQLSWTPLNSQFSCF